MSFKSWKLHLIRDFFSTICNEEKISNLSNFGRPLDVEHMLFSSQFPWIYLVLFSFWFHSVIKIYNMCAVMCVFWFFSRNILFIACLWYMKKFVLSLFLHYILRREFTKLLSLVYSCVLDICPDKQTSKKEFKQILT